MTNNGELTGKKAMPLHKNTGNMFSLNRNAYSRFKSGINPQDVNTQDSSMRTMEKRINAVGNNTLGNKKLRLTGTNKTPNAQVLKRVRNGGCVTPKKANIFKN